MALAVKTSVRGLVKGMRIGGDFWKELDNRIKWKVTRAMARAKANGRKTVRACDL